MTATLTVVAAAGKLLVRAVRRVSLQVTFRFGATNLPAASEQPPFTLQVRLPFETGDTIEPSRVRDPFFTTVFLTVNAGRAAVPVDDAATLPVPVRTEMANEYSTPFERPVTVQDVVVVVHVRPPGEAVTT